MSSIDVAVIPAAGKGTRMRPATNVVPKALITVVDRPSIQWVVEEAVAAGAREVILVVDPWAGDMVEQHFSALGTLPGLEDVEVRAVIQHEAKGLGHAVYVAAEAVAGRPFFCLLADDLVAPGASVLDGLSKAASDGASVLCLRELPDELLSSKGVVDLRGELAARVVDVAAAVEKPGRDHAPSNLGIQGRYLFMPEVFDLLADAPPGHGGEIQLTDAINELARAGRCRGYVADTVLLDVGNPDSYLHATAVLAGGSPDYGEGFKSMMRALLED